MFATLKSFLVGNGKSSKPIRRTVRLGLESLEAREVPASCAVQTINYNGLEGETYQDVKCGTYVIQGNKDLSVDDYQVTTWHGPFYHGADPSLELKGRTLTIKDELSSSDEGPNGHTYTITRKRDSKVMLTSVVHLDAGNAPINAGTGNFYYAINGHEPPRQLLATFEDTHSGNAPYSAYYAKVSWGDGATTDGEVEVSGNTIKVYGRHTYKFALEPKEPVHKSISVTLGEGYYAFGSKFCSNTHTVADPKGGSVAVGGMATAGAIAEIAPFKWIWETFGENAVRVEEAVHGVWTAFAGDAKDSTRDIWKKLSTDEAANQKLLVSTAAAVVKRIPSTTSMVWDGIMQEAIRLSPSRPGRTLNQVAFDVALKNLTTMLQAKLSALNVTIPGITTLDAKAGVAAMTESVRKFAETAAKGIGDRTMLERYLKVHRPQINPGKPADDNATLTAANMDLVLKATTGAALAAEKSGIANWQSLESLTSQRIGRAATFGAEQSGKDLKDALAALADGSTGILHSAPTQAKPNGALLSFVKVNGQVFILDARLGLFASLNAATMYQMLNTTK